MGVDIPVTGRDNRRPIGVTPAGIDVLRAIVALYDEGDAAADGFVEIPRLALEKASGRAARWNARQVERLVYLGFVEYRAPVFVLNDRGKKIMGSARYRPTADGRSWSERLAGDG